MNNAFDPSSSRSLESQRTMRGNAPVPALRLRVGDVLLGRYTVLSELGEGGMGVVYKCLDSVGGIEVAVKCLPPELSRNEGEMEGIRENYGIVAKLHHSAISGLRQLERDPVSGEYYLVMDLAEGEDLSAILRRRRGAPMPLEEALAILRPLASALDYAHGEKVLHRDVKPANVKVRPAAEPGEAPRVQLLDFGLAAEIRSSMSRVSVRGHGGTSGTPAYMAPEQWEARRPDFRTDQYALAVVAYQMLAGFLPFDSEDTDLLRRAVLSRAPDPVEGLSPAANAALLRALAKDPKERFPSCTAFVAALASGKDMSGMRPPWHAGWLVAALLAVAGLGALLLSPSRGGGEGVSHAEPAASDPVFASAPVPAPEPAPVPELQPAPEPALVSEPVLAPSVSDAAPGPELVSDAAPGPELVPDAEPEPVPKPAPQAELAPAPHLQPNWTDLSLSPNTGSVMISEAPDGKDHPIGTALDAVVSVYRPWSDDGFVYFCIEFRCKNTDTLSPIPRDVLLAQDASRSISPERLHFCREAILGAISESLLPTDRFNILAFNNTNRCAFGREWRPATPNNVAEARAFIEGVKPDGNTDIYNAAKGVLDLPIDPHRATIVFLLSDGMATAGDMCRDSQIIGEFSSLNSGNVSVFTIGVSARSDEYLLSMLSFCNRGGTAAMASDRFHIPEVLSNAFRSVAFPVLNNLRFIVESTSGVIITPRMTENLYLDRPLRLYGRAPLSTQDVTFLVRGENADRNHDMFFSLRLGNPAPGSGEKEIAREWARMRIYDLVAEYAIKPRDSILDEMDALKATHGVRIPFRDLLR